MTVKRYGEFCPNCPRKMNLKNNEFVCPNCGYREPALTWRPDPRISIIESPDGSDKENSIDRQKCSQKAKPFTEILREAGNTEEEIKDILLTYLAKRWFYCHVCGKHFEEDQIIWYHMEEEYKWCHDKCRGFEKLTDSNPSRKTGIDLQIWRQQQRGFDTRGG